MENSLRNHALVQQQNQLQQRSREDYYRNNGILLPSSASAAPASSSHHGNSAMNHGNSNRSRTSGSSTSGKGSRSSATGSSRSTRSGEASDEAVQGVEGPTSQHRYHNQSEHQLHLQQQQHKQQYHYHHQQAQHQYHQQQRYPQHYQYYSNNEPAGVHHQQHQEQYGYLIHRDDLSGSQQSSSYNHQYPSQQQYHSGGHALGSATEATADSQSHYSNILSSVSGSLTSNPNAEEAFRRLGLRLSWSAHGGESEASRSHRSRLPPPQLGFKSHSSCFRPFQEALTSTIRDREGEEISSNGNNSNGSGSSKSNKSGKGNLVRKMTLNASDLFRLWQTERFRINHQQRRRKNSSSDSAGMQSSRSSKTERSSGRDELSPHRRAFAQMSLGDGGHIHSHNHGRSHNNMLSSSSKKQPGSLTAVIESASQNSSTATRSTTTNSRNPRGSNGSRGPNGVMGDSSVRSEDKSRASSSIATRSSMGTRNSFRSFGTLPPRGSCLTQPSEGVSNDNLCDNIEGNLIVYENDNISVPKKQVCVLTRGKIPRDAPSADFRVQSLLGQGTFAQVFRCLHVQTGKLVAVKIIKNKPAYTRQAAVEIDVIRALTTIPNGENTSRKNNKSYNDKRSRSKSSIDNEGLSPKNTSSEYMIDMVCYFLYKEHLCLVFELLGLNLYEVLKKRQFRGLPLHITQTLVRQAVMGAKILAQRSIVHCDLKPENILLVDEDDSEAVMSAGESKRLHAPSSQKKDKQQSDLQKELAKGGGSKGDDRSNEGKTESSEKSKSTNNTDSTNQKTQTGQTHVSDNSKSTTATDNTKKGKEQLQQRERDIAESTTIKMSKTSSKEKTVDMLPCKSPMDSTIATIETNETQQNPACGHQIKLIDFGSACFEGQMSHTYIQSRFYRSPEVLLGLAYDSAIDMWSLGCVAAELFLGLPILPGVHEHDQLGRIIEMIGDVPDWMLDQGTKSSKYFVKFFPASPQALTMPIQSPSTTTTEGRPGSTEAAASGRSGSEAPRPLPQWRIKTQHEYIASLSQSDIEKNGGLAKLQKQPGNRYFKRKLLSDIILHKGQSGKQEDLRQLKSFIHFLYGILDPDPWKRWTAFQVASHPFFTGATLQENVDPSKIKDGNHANRLFNLYWEAPSDPTIYRRKLLNVQKTREKQQAARRSFNRGHNHSRSRSVSPSSQDGLPAVRNAFSKINNQGEDMYSRTHHAEETYNEGGLRIMRQGSYQGSFDLSSSMTQQGSNQGLRLLGHNSGMHLGFSGPQSFSEAGGSVGLPGSFNEVDFALALHRPGVVPMGDSVTTATTSTTSMSSGNNSRSTYNQNNIQTSQVGSYGSNPVLHNGNQQLFATGSIPGTSRSFGEGDLAPVVSSAIPTVIDSRHQQVLFSSSHGSGIDIGPPIELKAPVEISVDPPIELECENASKRPASATSIKVASQLPSEKEQTATEDNSAPATNAKSGTNDIQPGQNLGVYDNSQVYQQQLVAMQQQFQQQQLLLQQQQAALALQQEQLRAYYSNISNVAGMNVQQFGMTVSPATPTPTINAQQYSIPGATANGTQNISANSIIGAQQYGIASATAAAINAQQLGIAGAPASATATTVGAINAQQYSLPGSAQASQLQAASLNPSQFGLTGAPLSGGYFVVPTSDGNHMIVPSSQGVAIPVSGQVSGIAPQMPGILSGQLPGLPPGLPAQAMTQAGLQSVAVPPVTAIAGIPGMHAGGMIPSAPSISGMNQAMATVPMINSKPSPAPNGLYPSSDQQQHRQHQ